VKIEIGDAVRDLSDNDLMVAVKIRDATEHDPRRICCWSSKNGDLYWYDHEDMENWLEVIKCPG
tara:strand:- start:369 stop:560 length:192 start_codon:yes stop_codon:yes gene_type:complete